MLAPPLSLYVHLPWCVRKCPYCDFNSHRAPARLPERAYVDALLEDLARLANEVTGRSVCSVFFGGGTPSLFEPASIARVLEGVGRAPGLEPGAEVTLEANPGAADAGRFAGYRAAGVNRLSVGVQSFDDGCLSRIGRIHDARAAHLAIDAARAAGFERLNLDLMYALPGQELAGALADVRAALAHEPGHVSHYQLTLEPGTPFDRSPPPLPDDAAADDMQVAAADALGEAGYVRYEISAWARPGHASVHNLNYWRFGDYLGIGAGAHGKLTDARRGAVRRTVRERHPSRYVEGLAACTDGPRLDPVAPAHLPFEFALNAARLVDGFETALFEARTGLPRETIDAPLRHAEALGLVERSPVRVRPTALGLRFHNDLVLQFMPAG
jgi:oxygen-independent coproporphyrinogen-3 oxidase